MFLHKQDEGVRPKVDFAAMQKLKSITELSTKGYKILFLALTLTPVFFERQKDGPDHRWIGLSDL